MAHFEELRFNEKMEVDGGWVVTFSRAVLKKTIVGSIALFVIDNWSTTKEAVLDGVQDGMKTWN
ncbi:MAG TPA: hypothetical protein PKM27_04070 [Saprospiraceae bacterium]|nr:hypothetical protein [Saprospiraceae bacterium]HNT20470.1 hypothetical protein [Saprospiraceae bacterium]